MKEATSGDVFKFEKKGDAIEGVYMGYEASKQFPSSFALRVSVSGKPVVAFVSGIVIDLIKTNNIMSGQKVRVEFLGKKKTQDGKKEYNDYKVMYE